MKVKSKSQCCCYSVQHVRSVVKGHDGVGELRRQHGSATSGVGTGGRAWPVYAQGERTEEECACRCPAMR